MDPKDTAALAALPADDPLRKKFETWVAKSAPVESPPKIVPSPDVERTRKTAEAAALVRPNEFVPPPPLRLPGVEGFMTLMNGKKFHEPPVEEVRNMLRQNPAIGAEADRVDENSPLYRHYADVKWAQAYDDAAKNGYSIQRLSAIRPPEEQEYQNRYEGKGAEANAQQIENRFFNAATAHMGPAIADRVLPHLPSFMGGDDEAALLKHDIVSEGPLEQVGYDVGSSLLPGSLASKIAGRLGKTMGVARGMAGGAVRGVAQAAGTAATIGGIEDAAEHVAGNDQAPDIADMGERALNRAKNPVNLIGGVLGGAEGLSRALRLGPSGEAIRRLEDVGGGTSLAHGVKAPKDVWQNIDEAERPIEEGGITRYTPRQVAAQKAGASLQQALDAHNETKLAPLQQITEQYRQSPQGRTPVPHLNTLQAVIKWVQKNQMAPSTLVDFVPPNPDSESGTFYDVLGLHKPVTRPNPAYDASVPLVDTRQAAKMVKQLAEFEPMSKAQALQAVQDGTAIRIDLAEAERLGFIRSEDIEKLGIPDHAVPMMDLVLRSKGLTAEQSDRVINELNRLTHESSARKGSPDPFLQELHQAFRQDREQFEPNEIVGHYKAPGGYTVPAFGSPRVNESSPLTGWAAFKQHEANVLDEVHAIQRRAGIRNPDEPNSSTTEEDLVRSAHGFGGDDQLRNEALEEIARHGDGATRNLRMVPATQAYQDLAGLSKGRQGLFSRAIQGAELRADAAGRNPAFRAAVGEAGSERGSVTPKSVLEQLRRAPTQSLVDWIRAQSPQ